MVVVSSFQTAATCKTIKILGNSFNEQHKIVQRRIPKSTSMDCSLEKLRKALMELREQDKGIYRQLVKLNQNIERLKEDVNTEQEKRHEFDHAFEEDDDDDDDGSEYEDDTEDQVENTSQIPVRSISLMPTNTGKMQDKEKDNDQGSVHERYDSGIIEDENIDEQPNNSTITTDDAIDGKSNSKVSSIIIKHKINEDIISPINKFGFKKDSLLQRHNCIEEESEDRPKLLRSRTLQSNEGDIVRKRNHYTHRRSLSANQIQNNLTEITATGSIGIDNAGFNAATPEMPLQFRGDGSSHTNLSHISENSTSTDPWTMNDVKHNRNTNSRKLYRHKIPRENNFTIINSSGSIRLKDQATSQRTLLNSSLTQLNLQGAISVGTIKAIQRSSSIANCSTLGRNHKSSDTLSKSLNISKGKNGDKWLCRRTKSSSGLNRSRSDFINNNWEYQSGSNILKQTGNCKDGIRPVTRMPSTVSLV